MTNEIMRFTYLTLATLSLTACDSSSGNDDSFGHLTIQTTTNSLAVDGTSSATISLSGSNNASDQAVFVTSQDGGVLTVDPAACSLSTAHSSCTVTLTGVSIGITTISATSANYATVSSENLTVAQYSTLNYSAAVLGSSNELTGIRGVSNDSPNVYISGIYEAASASKVGLLYQGPLNGSGTWYEFNYPNSIGITVTNTSLYGPNNGNQTDEVQLVGNYTTSEQGADTALGLVYQGTIADRANTNNWLTLTPPSSMYAQGDSVLNTIAHSTMGGYIVGNYDTALVQGRAFICDITSTYWLEITHAGALSITAYGIWYNGGTSYTIAGGYSDVNNHGADSGYLVDWDSTTHTFSHWQSYAYENQPLTALVSHFEGLTSDGGTGFYLPANWVTTEVTGAAITHISVNNDGSFGAATWTDATYPGSSITSANSTYLNNLIGVYQVAGSHIISGFVGSFPSV